MLANEVKPSKPNVLYLVDKSIGTILELQKGPLVQSVEHSIRIREVTGAIPVQSTKRYFRDNRSFIFSITCPRSQSDFTR